MHQKLTKAISKHFEGEAYQGSSWWKATVRTSNASQQLHTEKLESSNSYNRGDLVHIID